MISVVLPFFNEKESLPILLREILRYIDKKDEIIFVDDGSTDGSLKVTKKLAGESRKIRLYSFRKNHGKAEILTFGFQKAKGNVIITLDADLQDKPSEIPKLLKKLDEGWDVVCGWRKKRNDPFFKVLSSKLFNFLARVLWGLQLHDYNCGLKAYKKEAAKALNLYGGMHRFIPLLLHDQGFSVTEVAVEHGKRRFGTSKYGFSKLWKDLPDILSMLFLSRYSKRPLHFFALIGGILLVLGFSILFYLTILHFQGYAIGRRPLLIFGMLFVVSGLQVILTGFLADLIINQVYSSKEENKFNLRYSSDLK